MPKSEDPFYTRQRIPDEFIEHVGQTGLTPQEELQNRERKFSATGQDVRKFDTKKSGGWHPQSDPYYGRKQVPDTMIHGVGETGLTAEEEYLNRERKYSVTGVDVRRFDTKPGSGFHPNNDPYYARKPLNKAGIEGVGETGMSKAEEFQYREDKAHLFQESGDPFAVVMGTGHRGSVSAQAGPAAAEARRRSSAVAPDHTHAARQATQAHGHHSGYDTHGSGLAPIESRPDEATRSTDFPSTTTTTTTTTQTSTSVHGPTSSTTNGGHTHFYEEATKDLDSVAPHERA